MKLRKCSFVIPGDINTPTGGYIYDRKVIEQLRNQDVQVELIGLSSNFPNPSPADQAHAREALAQLPKDSPVIIDGLALGALDPGLVNSIGWPIIALVHHPLADESGLDDENKKRLFETEFLNLQNASKIIVPSSHTASVLVSDYWVDQELITVAKPGFDLSIKQRAPIDPPLIISVGIQVRRKGHDVLLKALSETRHLPWQAVIAGSPRDAEYSKQLLQLRRDLNLESRVELVGHVDDARLADYYSKASVFALATRHEGYGMVFDEAMAYGLPIVTCDSGAVSETVGNQAAFLIEPDSPELMAEALARVLQEGQVYQAMSDAALQRAAELGSWAVTAKHFIEALDSLGR